MVLADRGRGLARIVTAGIADAGMNALDSGFRLLPVVADLHFAAHGLLRLAQRGLVSLEAVERCVERAIRQCGEPGNTHIDTDRAALLNRRLNFAFGLDTHEPLAARLAHGDVLHRPQYVPAVAIALPAELGQEQAVVGLVEFDLFRVGITEALRPAFLLEAREVGTLGEEVAVGWLQILEHLLQRVDSRIRQPRGIGAVAPPGE